jgi:hypothetical protein
VAFTAETDALQAQLEQDVATVTDAQAQVLLAAWVLAWSEVSGQLEDALASVLAAGGQVTQATIAGSQRLLDALDVVYDQLTTLAAQAGVTITADLESVVAAADAAQDAIVASQLPLGFVEPDTAPPLGLDRPTGRTTRLDDALTAIVTRTAEQIESRLNPLPAETADVVRRELIRGVAVGANPRETAARMVERAEGEFNGGLTRALAIARTETLDAHRAAAQRGQARHSRVLAGWVWDCALAERTCPACLSMDGREFPLETPGPQGHVNCRCSRRPKTKSWADLGVDLPEPPPVRQSARAWFDALPRREKVAILGRRRLELLEAGLIGWEDLAREVPNDDWRPSWQVTPVSVLERQARRRSRSA